MSDVQQIVDYPIVYDLDMEGGIDKKGHIKEVWNVEALTNSIKMWMSSFRGDILRGPDQGGYIAEIVMRPMTETDAEDFEQIIRNGFNEDFRPYLRVYDIEVVPNYERRYWNIRLQVYSPDLKIYAEVDERIKATA